MIPVERIHGPVMLDCGGADHVWVSCEYAQAIINRLRAHHDANQRAFYAYPTATHGIGEFVPYEPGVDHSDPSYAIDQQDRTSLYKRLLAFLGQIDSSR